MPETKQALEAVLVGLERELASENSRAEKRPDRIKGVKEQITATKKAIKAFDGDDNPPAASADGDE